jgi:hypothetical protein
MLTARLLENGHRGDLTLSHDLLVQLSYNHQLLDWHYDLHLVVVCVLWHSAEALWRINYWVVSSVVFSIISSGVTSVVSTDISSIISITVAFSI